MRKIAFLIALALIVIIGLRAAPNCRAQDSPRPAATANAPGQDLTTAAGGFASAVTELATLLYAWAGPYLVGMAAIGAFSMALIQTTKNMFPILRAFQRWYVKKWLKEKANEATKRMGIEVSAEKAEHDMINLATDGNANALFDLPIDQLCGQLNAATALMLDFPADHPDLLRCLASLDDKGDVERLMGGDRGKSIEDLRKNNPAEAQALIDARTRVTHLVQRSVDGLQIAAGGNWKFRLQRASFILSAVLTLVALGLQQWYDPTKRSWPSLESMVLFVVTAIAAGFIAPVARDLLASIEQLRG